MKIYLEKKTHQLKKIEIKKKYCFVKKEFNFTC